MRAIFLDGYTNTIVDYSIALHRREFRTFIVWGDLVVASNHNSHKELRKSYIRATGSEPDQCRGGGRHYRAPEFDADNVNIWVISSWEIYDDGPDDILTPEELFPTINEILGMTH